MADYKKFFKRENFIASMQAAKERKQKWEREVQQKWDELNKELEPNDTKCVGSISIIKTGSSIFALPR